MAGAIRASNGPRSLTDGFVSEPKGGGWQWGLELKRYGFPGATRAISGVPLVNVQGQRLTYDWDSVVQEW